MTRLSYFQKIFLEYLVKISYDVWASLKNLTIEVKTAMVTFEKWVTFILLLFALPTTSMEQFLMLEGSPGLSVMGGDSCSKCHGFKFQHCILDGLFSHIFVAKLVMFFGKDKN